MNYIIFHIIIGQNAIWKTRDKYLLNEYMKDEDKAKNWTLLHARGKISGRLEDAYTSLQKRSSQCSVKEPPAKQKILT